MQRIGIAHPLPWLALFAVAAVAVYALDWDRDALELKPAQQTQAPTQETQAPTQVEPPAEVPDAEPFILGYDKDDFAEQADALRDRLDRDYGKGFFRYYCDDGIMPRPYFVAAERKENVDPETQAGEYAKIFSNLYRIFFEEYGDFLGLDPVTEPVPVLIFDSKDSYTEVFEDKPELKLSDPEFLGGYYRPWTGEMIQWGQPDLWSVMFHEGTHQLVDFCSKGYNAPQMNSTPWFSEGIAEFMGGHKRKMTYSEEQEKMVTKFTLGQFLQGRFSHVQSAISSGRYLPLKKLTHMSFMEFKGYQNQQSGSSENQNMTGLVYSQGWALVMFLNKYNEGTYKPLFDDYFALEIRGEANGEAFAEIFGLEADEDWDDLDEEFKIWVNTDLRRMRRKK